MKQKIDFIASAKAIERSLDKEVMASLLPLLNAVEEKDVEIKDDQILIFAGDLYVAGIPNKNNHLVTTEDALKYYKTAENKFVDLEHDRGMVVGFIHKVFLSSFDNHEILTEEQASKLDRFNVSIIGYLWTKIMQDNLTDFLISSSDETSENYNKVSLSFEYYYDDSEIYTIDNNGKYNKQKHSTHSKFLLTNRGKGVDNNGHRVIERMKGDQGVSGAGLVYNPGAHVKGILIIDPNIEKEEKKSDKNIISSNLSVKSNVNIIDFMHKKLTELLTDWDNRLSKLPANEAFASFDSIIQDALKEADIDFQNTLKKERESSAALKETADSLQSTVADLKEKLENSRKEYTILAEKLANIEKAQQEQAALDRFNSQMNTLSSVFELDEEDTQIVAQDLKVGLTDEAFAAYMKKQKKLMKSKMKDAKASLHKNANEILKKGLSEETLKEVFASLELGAPELPTGTAPVENIKESMRKIFEDNIEVKQIS